MTTADGGDSPKSVSTVSLSDSDLQLPDDDRTFQSNSAILVTFTDLESTSTSENSMEDGECTSDADSERNTALKNQMSEEEFQQHLSLLKCRYRAELEKIEDEVVS